ncbi:CRISPR-associated protein Cas2 [Bisgaardia hudsonensis]|uniref:CRISPR-associated endoribonuclease Cas2 n=1 Tax=Bisgaardia hudsonensis TaxID=109472 RepID=A0A4R2N146_9PAST|nr:CRISPR-associated endonuclease Cas2 [Bisgaardia hudsonensis]TCP13233.1 CRISPR-associated protein Cas2 [Bisgaardia hudsonensis]
MKYRTRYLITYDISDPKRLYKIHKKVNAYAIGGQKSFYECWLNEREFKELKENITALIEEADDKIFIFQLNKDTTPILYGKAKLQSTQPFLII